MCDPLTAGLILTGGGTAAKVINNNVALRRQDRAAAEGIRRQSDIRRNAAGRIDEQIQDIAASTGEAERAASLEGFLSMLRDAQDVTGGTEDPLAVGGQRFVDRVAAGEAETRQAGVDKAEILSRIIGPSVQRQREAGRVSLTAADLSELARQSEAQDFITRLRVASKRPNPLIDAIGDVGIGAGSIVSLRPSSANLKRLARLGSIIDSPTTFADGPTGAFA